MFAVQPNGRANGGTTDSCPNRCVTFDAIARAGDSVSSAELIDGSFNVDVVPTNGSSPSATQRC